jgi:tripartite-type tricarboxylate transporter receptor subunit TctC
MLISLGAAVLPGATYSQDVMRSTFPARPITLIVPWPQGGSTDICMRALAEATVNYLEQPIEIKNMPGASGVLGALALKKASAGENIISQMPFTVFRAPYQMEHAPFDPRNDFTYIVGVSAYTFGVVVSNNSRWKTWNQFLEYAKANPNKVSFGTPGTFTTPHITMNEIARIHGIKWVHSPFRGSTEDMEALLNGDVDAAADSSSWGQYVDAGKLRLLVTWGNRRSNHWGNVPTLREYGDNIVSDSPYGIAGPKNMDTKIVKALHDAFKKGIEDPIHLSALKRYDQQVRYMSSHSYANWANQTFLAEEARMTHLKSILH